MTANAHRNRDLFPRPLDLVAGRVDLTHGGGGRAMAQLIAELFAGAFDNPYLAKGNDMAVMPPTGGRLVMSTDGYVVSPIFFPGGDIGSLSVHGTVNDVAMSGARPLYLSASFILEEGLPLSELKHVVESMAAAAKQADVLIVTGDTKVVERGKADGIFIATTGIGSLQDGLHIAGDRIRPGDAIILSGTIGDHGIALLSKRENLEFETAIESDSAPLHGLIRAMIEAEPDIHCLRDPTRGGLAATLNELAHQSGLGMIVDEDAVPIRPAVRGACELLGIDPFGVANEGKLIAFCPADKAEALVTVMRDQPFGENAAIIGHAQPDPRRLVWLRTSFGSQRVVEWFHGEQLPRIC
ncbi:hydrogenase expression/formation protein HypE [Rhizobium wenxiniae]|uniref:hydrogenase expression/formation protein HypE n=1 Tax=Rhizobium wenxiniae TaxID=1737357 RepID=UPI001C6F4F64|nr:hydrogenase expression/formation protein HypE [Rhizobium wenxiniae]MBW9088832.1 hydrogenase expression/formation protein HypE [Rhizobium wenxiniae]